MMRDCNPKLFWLLFCISVLEGSLMAVTAYATGHLVSTIGPAIASGDVGSAQSSKMFFALGFFMLVFCLAQVPEPLTTAGRDGLRAAFSAHRRERVMRATMAVPGTRHLEDPDYLDALRLASSRTWPDPGAFAVGFMHFVKQRSITVASGFVIGITFSWWVGILTPVVWGLLSFWLRQGQAEGFSQGSSELRRSKYFHTLAFDAAAGKEVRIFGLREWLVAQFSESWHAVMHTVWRRRRGHTLERIAALAICLTANGMSFGYLAWSAFHGQVSGGDVTAVGFAMLGISHLAIMNEHTMAVSLGTACFPAILELERRAREDPSLKMSGTRSPDGIPIECIEFRDVVFRYPGNDSPVFDGLNLTIEAGRSLGIVGNNGAGKTTLIKLMSRLYDPDAGAIYADGVDIREFDPRQWQRRIAAIFQDFVHYPYSVGDNVGFGSIERTDDHEGKERAVELVGAKQIIDELPHGWSTLLSRRFEGGAEISGGQWQRIALARAVFAVEGGAGLLILDEPTANLDARAEVQLFDRFLDVTRGSTAVLISHRFSTVRRADRIVVIERGRVVEQGTHDELLRLDGRYAHSFHLQAGRYQSQDGES